MKKFLFAILFLAVLQTNGQNLKFDGVLNIKLRNTGVILGDDQQVKGYYYFYNVEKADRKNSNYLLKLSDENLREISSVNIVKPNSVSLIEAQYNGSAFAFLFYNPKEKMVELITYDKTLKELGSVQKIIKGKYNIMAYNQIYLSQLQGQESVFQLLVGVKDKGFLLYGLGETKKYHYSQDYYDNTCKFLWNSAANPESKDMIVAESAFQTDKVVGSTLISKKGLMSKDASYSLLVNDLNTGKELFNVEIADPNFNLSATKITFDEGSNSVMVFGEYFELNDKEYKSNAIGYFYLVMDLTGKINQKKFISWGKDLSKFITVDKEGKMEKGARVFVHEIIRTADGDVFVIGEQYKKAANAGAIAMNALGNSGVSNAKLTLMNIIILQFDKNLDAKGVHVFEKTKDSYALPQGAEFMSAKMIALYGQANGWFAYNFFQIFKDKNTFIVTYNDDVKEKGEKWKSVLYILVYTPEKVFATDKVVLNRKSSQKSVSRAKSGYVMVAEYYKKEKNLDLRLEKINY